MKQTLRRYAPKSAFSFKLPESKLIRPYDSKCKTKFWCCTQLSNTQTCQRLYNTCTDVSQSSDKTTCHFKSWWVAACSWITGGVKSSSGASPVLIGWPLSALHHPVCGECVSFILYRSLGAVLDKAMDTDEGPYKGRTTGVSSQRRLAPQ